MYLLDTNVISESGRSRVDTGVKHWLDSVPFESLHLSSMTDFELERGVRAIQRRDPAQAERLRSWVASIRRQFDTRILDITADIARVCAALVVPDPRPLPDAFIAATAIHHRLTVVTRNERDFDIPGLRVINPFR